MPTRTLIQSSSKRITYPGDVKIKDLNGDHVIDYGNNNAVDDHGDKTVIGNALPRYAYSINLSVTGTTSSFPPSSGCGKTGLVSQFGMYFLGTF